MKKITAVFTAVAAATALVACSTEPTMSAFQNPRPWQTKEGDTAYESLTYAVTVYDTKNAKNKVAIADGTLNYTLCYNEQTATGGNATLDMSFTVTYNDNAPEKYVGVVDSIQSSTLFRADSLETISMEKTVSLGEREGVNDYSYSISADYGAGRATRTRSNGKVDKLKMSKGSYFDNEMMYYLARVTKIKKNSSTTFYMTSLFDCFEAKEFSQIVMMANADAKLTQLEAGDWLKGYVISKEQEEEEKKAEKDKEDNKEKANAAAEESGEEPEVFKLPCFRVSISINDEKHGPPHDVYYSERPLEDNGIRHKRVPVMMSYAEYSGSKQVRLTEYKLTALSFVKP